MKPNSKTFKVTNCYWPKVEFNPADTDHLNEYRKFLQKQHWGDGCPFILEWPFTNIISMIEHKVTRYHLANIKKFHQSTLAKKVQ